MQNSGHSDYVMFSSIVGEVNHNAATLLSKLGGDEFRNIVSSLKATAATFGTDIGLTHMLNSAGTKAANFGDLQWLSSLLFGPQQSLKLQQDSRYGDDLALMIKNGDSAISDILNTMGASKMGAAVSAYGLEWQEFLDNNIANGSPVQSSYTQEEKNNLLPYLLDPSIRGFAKGGYAAPGFAIVGEEGPELVNFSNPGRVYTAEQTREAFSGGGNEEVITELKATRAVLSAIMSKMDQGDKAIVAATQKVEKRIATLESNQKLAAAAPVRY